MCTNQLSLNSESLRNKLDHIFRNSNWCQFNNSNCVINLSFNLTFTLTVLGYGLSFALHYNSNSLVAFISDFDHFESKCQQTFDVAKDYF